MELVLLILITSDVDLSVISKQAKDCILAVTDNYSPAHIDEVIKKLAGKTSSKKIDINDFTKKVFKKLKSEKKDKRRVPKISESDMLNQILNNKKMTG